MLESVRRCKILHDESDNVSDHLPLSTVVNVPIPKTVNYRMRICCHVQNGTVPSFVNYIKTQFRETSKEYLYQM